ncbi:MULTISPECIES: sigma-54 interaction domain-containing protein [unclassified Sedimentibacter]|uniref:sigma-54 interaction domain-containing protein n=1 Tax=unclassified Sedimentibacter TaxID=2649220 RepID=UPI0027E168C1|nr:sigma 54-interacting transcriptional regulator [Sedimentibacter sp. MB35-C1]WMJ76954.1 sigma 54-interacting transcriptional regulator [Sedimentibacter sp. MB35-C1]
MIYNYSFPESYKYLNAFLVSDLVDHPIHIINNKGQIIFVNKAWCKTYNMKKEEAFGKHIQDIMSLQLKYFLSINEKNHMNDDFFVDYHLFDETSSQSTAILALKDRKKVSMVTNSSDDRKLMVTSTPIFNGLNEIEYVFTLVQDLTKISDWKERLDSEIEKNKILNEKIKFLKESKDNSKIIGTSKKIKELKSLIPSIAKTDASVLILGESGVGKEVLSKEIYTNSSRNTKPFITVNCAAIPENLLESEMFGYEKGAFTGAVTSKEGLFELANGGTILLDEIGSMPLSLQPKLLRVLQENEFMRVGGTKKIKLDVRVISATNENLFNSIKSGAFRQDLYYRLNVLPLKIPPLRERKEDIKLFCLKFLEEFNIKYDKNNFFNDKALFYLEQYDWPGNIRELKNAIERLVIVGEKDVINANQVLAITNPNEVIKLEFEDSFQEEEGISLKAAVQSLERKLIKNALKKYKTTYKAAIALKTTQPTIVRKAKQLGIEKTWEQ